MCVSVVCIRVYTCDAYISLLWRFCAMYVYQDPFPTYNIILTAFDSTELPLNMKDGGTVSVVMCI